MRQKQEARGLFTGVTFADFISMSIAYTANEIVNCNKHLHSQTQRNTCTNTKSCGLESIYN